MIAFSIDPITFESMDNITGYTSLIWTERYLDAGGFELRTPLVEETMALLPEDSLLGQIESREVMIVETHEIETDDNGIDELIVKGSTYEMCLEDRFITGGAYGETWKLEQLYTAPQMAMVLAWNSVANDIYTNVLRTEYVPADPKEIIPNVGTSLSVQTAQPTTEWWLENGPVYPKIKDFMVRSGGGIRNIRPHAEMNPPSFDAAVNAGGGSLNILSSGSNDDKLRIDFYTGLDRTINQSDRPQVAFWFRAGHLDSPKYLFSTKGMKNVARVFSSAGNRIVTNPPGMDGFLNDRHRRLLYIDGGSFSDPVPVDWQDKLDQVGAIELAKHNRTQAIATGITLNTPFKYGTDYGLGDKVTVLAGHGYTATMMVNEYIRTEDSEGDRGFPTLILA